MAGRVENNFLNTNELIEHAAFEPDPSLFHQGLKIKFPKNDEEEKRLIESYQDGLRKVLANERVTRTCDRSVAIIEDGQIKPTRRCGNWRSIGNPKYVQPHEALYLMEMNYLEIYFNDVILSLERAYHMFIRDESNSTEDKSKLSISEYLVYSHLMRFGCHIKKYAKEDESSCSEHKIGADISMAESTSVSAPSPQTMNHLYTFNYLNELLNLKRSIVPARFMDRQQYDQIKNSMNNIIKEFHSHTIEQVEGDTISMSEPEGSSNTQQEKRKLPDEFDPNEQTNKVARTYIDDGQYYGSGATNSFMMGDEFKTFGKVFEQIDVIRLKTVEDLPDTISSIDLKFTLDLWTTNDVANNGPNFRIAVVTSSREYPRNDEILQLYASQRHKAAIMVVCVNDDLSFHAYIYRFTTENDNEK